MSIHTDTSAPGSLSWDGFLDTMLGLGKILGILIGCGIALTLILLPIIYLYHRCKKRTVLSIEKVKSEDEAASDIELVNS